VIEFFKNSCRNVCQLANFNDKEQRHKELFFFLPFHPSLSLFVSPQARGSLWNPAAATSPDSPPAQTLRHERNGEDEKERTKEIKRIDDVNVCYTAC